MRFGYKSIFMTIFMTLLMAGVLFLEHVRPSEAQVSLQFGLSDAKVMRVLNRNGFDQIEVYDRGLTSTRVRACKEGVRYRIKITIRMRLSGVTEIGKCRRPVTAEELRVQLRNQGYRRINIDEQNGFYVAIACNGNARTRLTMDHFGEIKQQKNVGSCKKQPEPGDIAVLLREQGYNRIDFTDRQLPKYVAEACLNNKRLQLELNRFGQIRRQTRIGRCDPPIDPTTLYALLRDKGFDRIQVLDDQLPRYVAQACRGDQHVTVTLNRFGRIIDEANIGNCASPVTTKQVKKLLSDNGFTRVHVEVNGIGEFDILACLDGQKKTIKLSRYGDLIDETDGGRCTTRSLSEVRDALSKRGMRGVKFYAEGCRKKRRIRILLNEFGERIGRERIGSC